jgi:sigma-B regulation protein RsbU (phosphoserine phosphatase)
MAMTTTLLRSLQRQLQDPGQMLARLNDELCRDNAMAMFVTLFVAVLDVRTGRLQFSNGGHNLPYVMSRGGIRTLANPGNGLALGAFDDVTYHTSEVMLDAGDGLLLYTDGVTEAMDSSQQLWSEGRLMEFLKTAEESAPDLLIQRLIDEVHRFAGGAEQSDDITVLALRYLGR